MISGSSPARRTWDVVILLLVLYTTIEVPFSIAFVSNKSRLDTTMEVLDIVLTVVFVIDLVSNFITSIPEGEHESYDHRNIARRYVGGPWFWVDLVSCTPTSVFTLVAPNTMDPSILKGLKLNSDGTINVDRDAITQMAKSRERSGVNKVGTQSKL